MKDKKNIQKVMPQEKKRVYHWWLWIAVGLIGLILLAVIFVIGFYFAQNNETTICTELEQENCVTIHYGGEEVDEQDEDLEEKDEEEMTDPEVLNVIWDKNLNGQVPGIHSGLVAAMDAYSSDFEISETYTWTIGKIKGGKYDDYELTYQVAEIPGLGLHYENYYVLKSDFDVDVLLGRYRTLTSATFINPVSMNSVDDIWEDESFDVLGEDLIVDSSLVIEDFELKDQIVDENGREFLLLGIYNRADFPNEYNIQDFEFVSQVEGQDLYLIRNAEDFNFYKSFNETFVIELPDSRALIYELALPFWPEGEGGVTELTIDWSEGTESTSYLKAEIGGCGFAGPVHVVDPAEIGELEVTGSIDGINIFEPINYNTEYFQDPFDSWVVFDETRTFDDFIATHPFFYYTDTFGRLLEFRNADIIPPAECAKPVIYLYPEEPMDMVVEVEPKGGFTYTDPIYNDGWRITAMPDGSVLNHDDNQYYPYLFWEGHGNLYSEPENYWVVAKNDVPVFLAQILEELGLNRVEASDFMEYWIPFMQDAEWYKIGFHGTAVMDMIAPLTISEKPDQVLRILMDYQELDAWEQPNPPQLPEVPERDGFTVIEWGGVKR